MGALVCGMCGNYNGQKADEFQIPDGIIAPSVAHFGNSWKSEEYSNAGCQPDNRKQVDSLYTPGEKMIIDSQCQELLSDKYKSCHHFVNPDFFIKNCMQDMTKYNGMLPTLCENIQNYVDACKEEAVQITWRNSTFCPLYCPPNSSYMTCAPACRPTCNNIYAESSCDKPSVCMEGCVCDNGFVLSDDSCVPISECGCRDKNDDYHCMGEIWLTPHCTQKCSCGKGGAINCTDYGCSPDENCSLKKNGQYICKSIGFMKCAIGGEPYYLAFDGLVHHFTVKHLYTLVETSDIPNRLQKFRIDGKNTPLKDGKGIVHLEEIFIEVYNHTVQFKGQRKLVVDGELVKPPVQPHDGFRIYQRSNRLHLETDFGLAISFDEKDNSDITLPITYRDWVCGLCGNFEGKRINDLTERDGTRITEVKHFGESWDFDGNTSAAGEPGIASRQRQIPTIDEDLENIELDTGFDMLCRKSELNFIKRTNYCGIISDPNGPFSDCHRFISPEQYQMHCIFSMCTLFNITEMMCPSLELYAGHCQEHGVTLGDWRKDTLCAMACAANSQYNMQMSACPASCSNFAAPSECEVPSMEGCECLPGFILSDFQCVPYKDCGCTYRNKYYEIGEKFLTEDCSETCDAIDEMEFWKLQVQKS
ncbi:hypothetical protein scyTo_0012435 [Scyliorhinus torazame]|uniref:VWFD domain-containing protein n=1 Tax=Scyliorhinus torazame TaxID=75743 RepID=A0A401P8K2_SCYTO|nr:hypothetical protein [Scyliorhinus torazame]